MSMTAERTPDLPFTLPESGTYQPQLPEPDELDRIKEEMRDNRVQITPDNVSHAVEAEQIRKLLRIYDIKSIHKVAATRDRKGMVRMPFEDFRRLLNAMYSEGYDDGWDDRQSA